MHLQARCLGLGLAAVLVMLSGSAHARPGVPSRDGHITDHTGTLAAQERKRLESKLASVWDERGVDVAILLAPILGDDSIEHDAQRVTRAWGLRFGKSVLLAFATSERQMRIEVSQDLKGLLPNLECERIVRTLLEPSFKQGDYFVGLDRATDRIIELIANPAAESPQPTETEGDPHDLYLEQVAIGDDSSSERRARPSAERVPAPGPTVTPRHSTARALQPEPRLPNAPAVPRAPVAAEPLPASIPLQHRPPPIARAADAASIDYGLERARAAPANESPLERIPLLLILLLASTFVLAVVKPIANQANVGWFVALISGAVWYGVVSSCADFSTPVELAVASAGVVWSCLITAGKPWQRQPTNASTDELESSGDERNIGSDSRNTGSGASGQW